MTPTVWFVAWILYLIIGIGGAWVLDHGGQKRSRPWLVAAMLIGALGLGGMASSLAFSPPTPLPLPPPWPAFVLHSVPLGPLWATVGGMIFMMATVATLSDSRQRHILYALLPLQAAVGCYLWSGDGLLLLLTWEFLSAITYLGLVTTRRSRAVWNPGWALLALSELGGVLLLLALIWPMSFHAPFLHDALGRSGVPGLSSTVRTVIMVLALVAFGVKAGLFPVMIWMPMAEPQAPGVVAGIFSGLLTALAVSGILLMDRTMHPGIAWAVILLVLGTLGALSAVLYGIVARHIKQILAYSTLEVLGLVFAALGMWKLESLVSPGNVAATLAFDAAIVLLTMHAGAKFVVFAATDHLEHWGRTIDRLGGLMHRAPWTGFFTLGGILALAGIPPLGGAVGEWLLLESFFKPLGHGAAQEAAHLGGMVVGGFLALTVALAITLYLRWFAFIFLGGARTEEAREAAVSFRWGLAVPWVLPLVSGPGIVWLLPWINRTMAGLVTTPTTVIAPTFVNPGSAAALVKIGVNLLPAPGATGTVFYPQGFLVGNPYVLFFLGALLVAAIAVIRNLARGPRRVRLVSPWTGGAKPYTHLTSYSGEGFVHPLRLAFARFYGLKRERHDTEGTRLYRHTIVYRVEEGLYLPVMRAGVWLGTHVRRIQSGQTAQYVFYVWAALLLALALTVWVRL